MMTVLVIEVKISNWYIGEYLEYIELDHYTSMFYNYYHLNKWSHERRTLII